ncbi:MAG: prephenate dehydrogenase [Treponema sp.]|nr:prephenate dehydrogenase [Treponema sp.]
MKAIEDCTAGIVGLGLMGGAVASALRKLDDAPARILACDRDQSALDAARARLCIDEAFLADEDSGAPRTMLEQCDLVFLCLNPSTLIRFVEASMAFFKSGCLITDVAGIKGSVAALAERLRPDIDFIPGHPMAGAEKDGFSNSGLVDFNGKNYILTPLKRNRPENLAFLKSLIRRMGFSRITETSAAGHDSKIAFTSQLCHVIAASLVDCEADSGITRYGGGSFEDLTRIAMLNAPMWTELFLENRVELLERVTRFEKSLDAIKALIASGDAPELEARLTLIRERRGAMER